MAPWACCNIEEEILSILDTGPPATLRHICVLIYPTLSWEEARAQVAGTIRRHCQFMVEQRLITEVSEDTFAPCYAGSA